MTAREKKGLRYREEKRESLESPCTAWQLDINIDFHCQYLHWKYLCLYQQWSWAQTKHAVKVGVSGKRKRDREKKREWHERRYKMPINFYCCAMKVWCMQREGTRQGAVTLLSLSNYQTPSCCCQLLKTCNWKIKALLQTERAVFLWLSSNKVVNLCMWSPQTAYTPVNIYEARIYLWVKRGPPTDTETPMKPAHL